MQSKTPVSFSAIVLKEGASYSSWCPDLDVASQGDTIEDALENLKEAIELHINCMSGTQFKEMKERQLSRLVTTIELPVAGA
ncbi:MAG: type II toxin-antitoxin system HicB family antitoxin [Candidatus Micrarchaeota archaeon]